MPTHLALSIMLVFFLLSALPMRAGASIVSTVSSGPSQVQISYIADPGELNALSISRDAGGYLITDPGARPLTVAGACTLLPPADGQTQSDSARCPADGVFQVFVVLNDGEDRLTIADSAYPPLAPPPGEFFIVAQGGPGRDLLTGGSGPDQLVGEEGGDGLTGGLGQDFLLGNQDNDEIAGGPGSDSLSGGDGDDEGRGGEGDDELRGGQGADRLRGDDGNDRLDFALTGFQDDETPGRDDLDGGPGDDVINCGPAREQEADVLSGGDGSDTADFSQRTEPLTIDLDGASDDGESGENDNVQPDVERVIGGSNADTLTGSSVANLLDGRDGEDTIEGGAGEDTLLGGANDPSGDNLSGGSGNDTMGGGSGDDSLLGGAGDDGGFGGGGGDRVEGENGNDSLTGGAGVDALDGGEGDDSLNGGDVVLIGGDGPDELLGGPGDDVLRGGRGNDRLDGGPGADYISGESEKDTVTYEDRTSEVFVTLDGLNDDGEAGEQDNVLPDVEVVLGGMVGDDLYGDADGNTVDGASGEDLIEGKLDPDRLLGGDSPDVVRARDGTRDEVACGDAGDLAIADAGDKVIECETVDRPGTRRLIVARYALVRPQGQFGLRLPQGRRFFPLMEKLKIPIGSTIDPRAGVIRLLMARNRTGARQAASVSAGRFTVRQTGARRPVTKLRLAGKLPDCRGSSTRPGNAEPAARPSTRRLRVDAGKRYRRGRFEVRGRYSVGGSSGTEWITADTCEGTLTRVLTGIVRVRDLVRRRTVMVRPGHRYLAAPR